MRVFCRVKPLQLEEDEGVIVSPQAILDRGSKIGMYQTLELTKHGKDSTNGGKFVYNFDGVLLPEHSQ